MTSHIENTLAAAAAPFASAKSIEASPIAKRWAGLSRFLLKLRGKDATNVDLAALTWGVMIVGALMTLLLPHGQPAEKAPPRALIAGR